MTELHAMPPAEQRSLERLRPLVQQRVKTERLVRRVDLLISLAAACGLLEIAAQILHAGTDAPEAGADASGTAVDGWR